MSLAVDFKEQLYKAVEETVPEKYRRARVSFWEYEKLINPKFFKESRPHLKKIAETLQALYEKRIVKLEQDVGWQVITTQEKRLLEEQHITHEVCRNMMMNIPPRHGKSYTMSLFADWCFGKDWENRIIAVTYNDILAGRFSTNVRDGIDATKVDKDITVFNDVFPDIHIKYGDSAKGMWSLEGQYFSYLGAGFGGTITGVGCSLGIIDDPVKNHLEAFNDDVLDNQYQWYVDTFLSRIEEDGIQAIIMTRWSSKDLCGRLLDDEDGADWYVLKMKACQDEEKRLMLCPELFSWKSYCKKKAKMSPAIFFANYQQEPVDLKGALYQKFMEYDHLPVDEDGRTLFESVKAYCDTADTGSDSLCNIVYGVYNMEAYVLDIIFTPDQMEKTEQAVARSYAQYHVNHADIESNNGGRGFARAVRRILEEDFGTNETDIEDFYQGANKIARIKSNATWVMNHIYYPRNWASRWPEYYQAMRTFQAEKKTRHDDAPDATTGIAEKMTGGADNWLI